MTETSGPRGRISLIKDVAQSRLDLLSDGFVEQMSQCLDCRACEAVCPSGVQYGRLLENARSQIRRAQAPNLPAARGFVRNFLMRSVLTNPRAMRVAARALWLAQRTGMTSLAAAVGLGSAAKLAPEIPRSFFRARDQRFEAAKPAGVAFLHVGCVMPVGFPNVHEATIRMLLRGGLSIVVPSEQKCCGAIATHAGDADFARELARRNIAAFERSKADVYVVNAAGCGSALKEYAHLLAADPQWATRAAAFSKRVRDILEVLDAVALEPATRSIEATATYQEPCHLVHAQRVAGAPRRLLARIPGLRLVEMNESAVCCGGAGTYNLTAPEMSSRLRKRKVDAIVATGASIVATANPGCAMQVGAGLREARHEARVSHVVELLDDAYQPV